jgi:hypothetical protein
VRTPFQVYDGTGRIVWSDESRLIGRTFPDDPSLASALRGNVATGALQVLKQDGIPLLDLERSCAEEERT